MTQTQYQAKVFDAENLNQECFFGSECESVCLSLLVIFNDFD